MAVATGKSVPTGNLEAAMRHDTTVRAELCSTKFLGHEAAGTRRTPSMSSVSYIRTPQPEGAQMYGTEEIRFKAGDACCSRWDQE